ncbi:MAG: prfA, partial [Deltaproteobacteria bacterium]|nr:prfA [Deltaproteobacteria bacterium]
MIVERLEEMERRFQEIEQWMALPENIANQEEFRKLAKEHAELRDVVASLREWRRVKEELVKTRELVSQEADADLKALAQEELVSLDQEGQRLEGLLKEKLLGKDGGQVKSMFLEIRAGTGGEEAALFAANLFNMYMKYAEKMKWKTELM